MKKLILLFSIIIFGCNQQIDTKDLKKINGYWEIVKVCQANGDFKDYTVNETIDFFAIKGNQGFRKKVTPQFNGKYLVNEQSEKIRTIVLDGKAFIEYQTSYAKWKEQIIEINAVELILKNDAGVKYYYKRPIPFSIK